MVCLVSHEPFLCVPLHVPHPDTLSPQGLVVLLAQRCLLAQVYAQIINRNNYISRSEMARSWSLPSQSAMSLLEALLQVKAEESRPTDPVECQPTELPIADLARTSSAAAPEAVASAPVTVGSRCLISCMLALQHQILRSVPLLGSV